MWKYIDKGANSFEDSVNIIRSCNGVITTDTSIAHLSLNMDVKTYVMLTKVMNGAGDPMKQQIGIQTQY